MRLHVGFGLLTVRRLRHITSASSWHPVSTENGHGATLPESLTAMALSGQSSLSINDEAPDLGTAYVNAPEP
jgi:hypothetical protein